MNRNQKIALGCGGAGCLGLIVVAIAGGLIYLFVLRPAAYRASTRNYNFNVNLNDNSSNSNSNSSSSVSSVASLSDDDKHKLFQAGAMSGDSELAQRVNIKLGLLNEDSTPTDEYPGFLGNHVTWSFRNTGFIKLINTPEKAKAYVDEHLPK
jgi:hypothetical protein